MSTQQTDLDVDTEAKPNVEDLRTRIAVLEEENRQLRNEFTRARKVTYLRTAIGLIALGSIGIIGGIIFPDARTVLLALGGTGIFAGFLTYVLTPEHFIAARIGDQVFRTLVEDRKGIVNELGLSGDPVYVADGEPKLFVPRYESTDVPERTALDDLFVVPEDPTRGGVAFDPIGLGLFRELEEARSQPLGADPTTVAPALADGVVELFELADGVDHDTDTEAGRVTFEIDGSRFGDPTAIDHPVVSFVAVGFAVTLSTTVHVTVTNDEPAVVTCRFD